MHLNRVRESTLLMPVLTATYLNTLINDTKIDMSKLENMIEVAINGLNLFDADIPHLTGTTPNRQVALTDKMFSAVIFVAMEIYRTVPKGSLGPGYGGLSQSDALGVASNSSSQNQTNSFLSNPQVLAACERMAYQLHDFQWNRAII